MNEAEVKGRLIKNTRTKNRISNLIDIAEDILWLKNKEGSLTKVASIVKVSENMLSKFLSVNKLSDRLKKLVKNRDLDSVSAVYNLSKYSPEIQEKLANAYLKGEIDTHEIKYLSPLIRRNPNSSIEELIDRLNSSKNIRLSVIKYEIPSQNITKQHITNKLSFLGEELYSIDLQQNCATIKITKEGENMLRSKAKEKNQTLGEFVKRLLG